MKKYYLLAWALIQFLSVTYAQVSLFNDDYYEVEVSSFGDYDMSGKTFYIMSGNKDVSNKDLEFLSYKDIVDQLLIRKKAILSYNQDSADVCVLMDYEIIDKSYVTTQGQSIIYSYKKPEYRRVLNLYAYDNKDRSGEPVVLWKVNAASDGHVNDLQIVLPYLVEATMQYVGVNSNVKKRCWVLESETEVYLMKNRYYINDNIIKFNPNIIEKASKPISVHSVVLEEEMTHVNLLATYHHRMLTVPKFKTTTYVVYKGQKYPVIAVYLPTQMGYSNYINKNIYMANAKVFIQLVFPVKMNKGDSFDLISYSNKKETKEFVRYENIHIE